MRIELGLGALSMVARVVVQIFFDNFYNFFLGGFPSKYALRLLFLLLLFLCFSTYALNFLTNNTRLAGGATGGGFPSNFLLWVDVCHLTALTARQTAEWAWEADRN